MATLLTDDFNRADNVTVLGGPVTGGPYTVRLGVWGINTNRALTNTVVNSHVTFPAAVDVSLQVTLPVLGSSGGLIARWVDANTNWLFGLNGTVWALMHSVAGTYTVFSSGPTAVAGDVIRFVAYGRNLYGLVNGKLVVLVRGPVLLRRYSGRRAEEQQLHRNPVRRPFGGRRDRTTRRRSHRAGLQGQRHCHS